MYKIKVCGLTDGDCVPVLNEYLPDFAGFILAPGFRRSIAEKTAAEIREKLSPKIQTVGVFVNQPVEKIASAYQSGIIQLVQLHGDEDEKYIAALKEICPLPVVKAIGINAGMVPAYPKNCDYILLDAYAPAARGGTGKSVQWRKYDEIEKPFFLAGGITPANVKEALQKVAPYGVDTSGGVETDGKKDGKKIIEYIKNIREVQ